MTDLQPVTVTSLQITTLEYSHPGDELDVEIAAL